MTVYRNSRYTKTPAYIHSATVALKMRERVKFNEKNYTYYTVVQGDTIDGISYKLYGKASLYWAIMDANKKYQSEVEIKAGDILAIPSYQEVVKACES